MENLIKQLNEPFLVDSLSDRSFFRLIVRPSFTNAYCIKICKDSGRISVTYKVAEDEESREIKFGVSHLTMTYEGKSKNIESLFALFEHTLVKSDYGKWSNNYDISPIADGTDYLMEIVNNGHRKVIYRVYGGYDDFRKMYKGANEFLEMKQRIESFVPTCLIQKKINETIIVRDFLFDAFQRN